MGLLCPLDLGWVWSNGGHWRESMSHEEKEAGGRGYPLFLCASSQGLGSVPLVQAAAPVRQPSPGATLPGDLKQCSPFPSYLQEVIVLTFARLGIFSYPFLSHFNPSLSFAESLY